MSRRSGLPITIVHRRATELRARGGRPLRPSRLESEDPHRGFPCLETCRYPPFAQVDARRGDYRLAHLSHRDYDDPIVVRERAVARPDLNSEDRDGDLRLARELLRGWRWMRATVPRGLERG